MSDEFTPYEYGISRLLAASKGESNQRLYRDTLLMQMQLANNIEQARKYGSSPDQRVDLHRILEYLIELSLSATGKSFAVWCQPQVTERQEQPDLSDMRREDLAQELMEAFIELENGPQTKQNLADEDLLERYASVPLHAVFLYTSEDEAISSYILDNWDALDSLSGAICDIHPLLEQFQQRSNAYEYIRNLDVVKEVSFNDLSQLPGLFFWDHAGQTAYVSFGIEAKPAQIKNVLRVVFKELYREPDLASIQRAKQILGQVQYIAPSRVAKWKRAMSLLVSTMGMTAKDR